MTHCYTDFLLLCALGTARKNEALADALTNTDALLCGCLTEDTLIHGLTVLQNEGYISLPGGEADADTVCLLTAKGRQAIAVPVLSRLFGRRDARSFRAGGCIPFRASRERRSYGRTAPRRVRHCTQPPAPRRRSERGLRRCAMDHGRPL